jgi:hypothetical protein
MHHLHSVSQKPVLGGTMAPEVKITFIITILQAAIPLFQNKDPQNPVTTDGGGDTEGES